MKIVDVKDCPHCSPSTKGAQFDPVCKCGRHNSYRPDDGPVEWKKTKGGQFTRVNAPQVLRRAEKYGSALD